MDKTTNPTLQIPSTMKTRDSGQLSKHVKPPVFPPYIPSFTYRLTYILVYYPCKLKHAMPTFAVCT